MAAPKGTRPPAAGMGRIKGVPNKLTQDVKAMILAALDGLGGQEYLMRQGQENPGAFMTLVGRVLPMQHTGADGGPIKSEVKTTVEDNRLPIGAFFAEYASNNSDAAKKQH